MILLSRREKQIASGDIDPLRDTPVTLAPLPEIQYPKRKRPPSGRKLMKLLDAAAKETFTKRG